MAIPLLKTKLYIPPLRPNLVSRPHLIERLNESLRTGHKLTLVSAPAGYGKTTLLSEWVRQVEPHTRVAWVSLDDGDNDLARFWIYLIAALQATRADIGQAALVMLRSSRPLPIEEILTVLINEIVEESDAPLTPLAGRDLALVLDDYHSIEAQSIHNALAFLLGHLPPHMHVVIAGRSDPPLPLSRLRGRSQMTELRQADLCFAPNEAAAFLNQVMGLDLSAEDVAALEVRTEGWIVGLQMAALLVQGRSKEQTSSFIRAFTGSHRYVLDYLTDEVLLRQPKDVQAFLLQTSILDRLTGPLCDAITGQENGQQMLEQLEAANLFVVPLDDERRWYRYHHLFAGLLRRRLAQTQADRVSPSHRRASEWYEEHGLIAEAVRYALAAGDVKRVARMVGGNALAMMEHGELATLEGWLDALPDKVMRSQPWLCIAHAWMLAFTGQLDAVETALADAEKGMADWDETTGAHLERQRLGGHVASIRSYVAGVRGNTWQAVELARKAQELLPADDLMTRSWILMSLGLYLYRSGDVSVADQALAEAVAISQATHDSHIAVLALCNLAAVQMGKGQLLKAADTFQEALQLAQEYVGRTGQRLPVAGYAYTYLANILCEWNDFESAMSHVEEGIKLCVQWGEPQLLTGGYICLAQVLRSAGDVDGALDAVHKARQAASSLSPWYAARVAPLEALIRLKEGDLGAASRWAALQKDSLNGYTDVFEYWFACLTLARIDIAQDRLDEALERLRRLLQDAEAAGGHNYVIASLALQAIVLQAQGKLDQALTALERALLLAEPEGYVRTFIDEGALMGELLRQAATQRIAPEYVDRLLAELAKETKDKQPEELSRDLGRASPHLVESLSERELEVLRLLAAGLSNREIAEGLYLSINTVKTHTKSIYSKLNVRSRVQAVNRAEELGIL